MATALAGVTGLAAAAYTGYSLFGTGRPVNLDGRVVLITGGGNGLGKSCAIAFARHGCDVVLWDLSEEELQTTRAVVIGTTPTCRCLVQRVDVTDRTAVCKAAEEAQAAFAPKHVSILVNNAGITGGNTSIFESQEGRIRTVFDVNVIAHFWTCQAFAPAMIEEKVGHIVTVTSITSMMSIPNMVDYAASKAAAFSFTEGLQLELDELSKGAVRTTVVCPALMKTELFKGLKQPFASSIFPALETDDVAERIVNAVRYCKDQLILPSSMNILPYMKAFMPRKKGAAMIKDVGLFKAMSGHNPAHGNERLHMMKRSKL